MHPIRHPLAALVLCAGLAGGPFAAQGSAKDAAPSAPAEVTGTCEVREDGSLLIDGQIPVAGQGTADKPFLVDWRLLVSAEQVYDPRAGKTALPAWTRAMEGKRIRLTGHLLLPVTGGSASELLIMQNEWDGCCIGVPPTPYDAVEVRLAQPLDTSRGAPPYGALEGTFKTDPYIVSGWLMGLYMLHDAKVVTKAGT